jgi:hypothetical protein
MTDLDDVCQKFKVEEQAMREVFYRGCLLCGERKMSR